MPTPDDRKYSKEHEWLRVEGDEATIGITDYAQDQLGDIVYVDLPETGTTLTQFAKMGEIESVKAVSELFSPASGEVTAANEALVQKPEIVNSDPYDEGWLLRVRLSTPADGLMSAAEYDEFVQGLG
jgi:glycine cleavage system H protein